MRRLTTDLVHFGEPLPMDIFNQAGQLLVKAGRVMDDEDLYRELLDFGFIEGEETPAEKKPRAPDTRRLLAEVGVLVADDNGLMRDIMSKSLRGLEVQRILRAEDGEIALALAGRYRPDIVFLDIDMPRRDGISALKVLREEFPDLFICMLSAHSSMENVRAALGAGASGFLVKPFQSNRLESILNQYLDKSRGGG